MPMACHGVKISSPPYFPIVLSFFLLLHCSPFASPSRWTSVFHFEFNDGKCTLAESISCCFSPLSFHPSLHRSVSRHGPCDRPFLYPNKFPSFIFSINDIFGSFSYILENDPIACVVVSLWSEERVGSRSMDVYQPLRFLPFHLLKISSRRFANLGLVDWKMLPVVRSCGNFFELKESVVVARQFFFRVMRK